MFFLFVKPLLYVFNVFKRVYLLRFSKIAKKKKKIKCWTSCRLELHKFLLQLGYKKARVGTSPKLTTQRGT